MGHLLVMVMNGDDEATKRIVGVAMMTMMTDAIKETVLMPLTVTVMMVTMVAVLMALAAVVTLLCMVMAMGTMMLGHHVVNFAMVLNISTKVTTTVVGIPTVVFAGTLSCTCCCRQHCRSCRA